jgi:hypothetical protein
MARQPGGIAGIIANMTSSAASTRAAAAKKISRLQCSLAAQNLLAIYSLFAIALLADETPSAAKSAGTP